jgi:hypothetical protein
MHEVFADHGMPRPPLLPIRWGRDTDLLISAIQGLDPWLKDGADRVWREGFLPQPVVRFTGDRDTAGRLRDGFLTSFVNLSCVQRISDVDRHAELIDTWLDALSAVGVHAGRLRITGNLTVWQRQMVSGITLHMSCDGISFADAVMLWHTSNPRRLATDLGSGLERLRWLLSSATWAETTFGTHAERFDVDVLDAVRTATLLIMAGIRPGGHGAGSALRRATQQRQLVEVVVQHRTTLLQGPPAIDPRQLLRQVISQRVRVPKTLALQQSEAAFILHTGLYRQPTVGRVLNGRHLDLGHG